MRKIKKILGVIRHLINITSLFIYSILFMLLVVFTRLVPLLDFIQLTVFNGVLSVILFMLVKFVLKRIRKPFALLEEQMYNKIKEEQLKMGLKSRIKYKHIALVIADVIGIVLGYLEYKYQWFGLNVDQIFGIIALFVPINIAGVLTDVKTSASATAEKLKEYEEKKLLEQATKIVDERLDARRDVEIEIEANRIKAELEAEKANNNENKEES